MVTENQIDKNAPLFDKMMTLMGVKQFTYMVYLANKLESGKIDLDKAAEQFKAKFPGSWLAKHK